MQVEVHPVVLQATNRELNVRGGFVGSEVALFDVRATNVNPSLFQFFVTRSLSGLDLHQLNVTGGWSNGPVAGSISGSFSVEEESFERLTAAVDLALGTNGLALNKASVLNPQAEIFAARGFLPVSLYPRGTNKLRVSLREEIDFEAETAANESFWKKIASLTGVGVSNAAVRLSVHGTTRKPTGELQVKGAGLEYLRTNKNIPKVGAFEGRVVLNEQVLGVPEFSLRVEDQAVTLAGKMQLGENFWTQRREEILPYVLDHAELHVDAPEVNLAPFTAQLPKYLRAQGKMMVDASILPGRKLDGRIEVREVETRPLAKIGVVQNIEADLLLRGQELQIENFSGVLGGETLSVGGKIDLSSESLAKGYPDIDLAIKGFNVPLARNPDVILRSDLDLQVRNGANQVPVISGAANLRDSFLLSDITKLVPGRVARPERRPPYFTVPQEPLDEWRLDVRVRGENFMRVRSPFFQGTVSANFHVTGNLEEPMALGEAAINSGRVIFPFASLEVKQALVSLTSENPYLPHVFMMAAGRAFGFDVRMEAEGPADEPVIEFSSVPSLTSEQIVLMLTTGQIPRQDFGFSEEDRASKLAFFLGKSLWSKLNPNKPAEERLTIRSGEDVTEQGRQTYEVEYKLNERWSLVGEYDRFGDLNANLKWRVFSR
jgi:translocation and assembly module TamB